MKKFFGGDTISEDRPGAPVHMVRYQDGDIVYTNLGKVGAAQAKVIGRGELFKEQERDELGRFGSGDGTSTDGTSTGGTSTGGSKEAVEKEIQDAGGKRLDSPYGSVKLSYGNGDYVKDTFAIPTGTKGRDAYISTLRDKDGNMVGWTHTSDFASGNIASERTADHPGGLGASEGKGSMEERLNSYLGRIKSKEISPATGKVRTKGKK